MIELTIPGIGSLVASTDGWEWAVVLLDAYDDVIMIFYNDFLSIAWESALRQLNYDAFSQVIGENIGED